MIKCWDQEEAEKLGIICSFTHDYEGLIPWQEEIPLTRERKESLARSLQEAQDRGEIDLSEFEGQPGGIVVGTCEWKEKLDEYFRDRGTTTEEYWSRMGYDPSLS